MEGIQAVSARISEIESRIASLAGPSFGAVLRQASGTAGPYGYAAAGEATATPALSSVGVGVTDARATARLSAYMSSRNFNSGLAGEAGTFLQAAGRNGVDWRLGVVLATVESSGGRECFRPNNPFGIMGHSFSSWREAVEKVNSLVAGYGLGNDLRAILSKYNPSGGDTYINNVIREMESI